MANPAHIAAHDPVGPTTLESDDEITFPTPHRELDPPGRPPGARRAGTFGAGAQAPGRPAAAKTRPPGVFSVMKGNGPLFRSHPRAQTPPPPSLSFLLLSQPQIFLTLLRAHGAVWSMNDW
jgi:hypothetical protein